MCHVLWSGHVGGIERLVCDLAQEQSERGMRVTVAFGSQARALRVPLESAGIEIVDLGFERGFTWRGQQMRKAVECLKSVDVIHLHGYNRVFDVATQRAARPIVFTEHGNFGHARARSLAGTLKGQAKTRFLRSVPAVTANSRFTAVRLSELYGIEPGSVWVVQNGSKTSGITSEVTPTGERLRVISVGRLVDWKRHRLLIDALSLVNESSSYTVEIVGGGPLNNALRRQMTTLGLESVVTLLGTRTDVPSLLAASDVLVHPSLDEPFGLVVLEAALAGVLPIVFADGGGVREVLPPDGIIVSGVEDLACTLERLARDGRARDYQLREKRRAWAIANYSIARTAAEYSRVYDAVGSAHHPVRPNLVGRGVD